MRLWRGQQCKFRRTLPRWYVHWWYIGIIVLLKFVVLKLLVHIVHINTRSWQYQVLWCFLSSYFLLVKISLFWSLLRKFFLFCRVDIQCPLVIDHGRIPTTCRRLTGDVCEFTCNEGYQPGVPETTILLCGSNGKWNQTSELCKGRALESIGIIEYL